MKLRVQLGEKAAAMGTRTTPPSHRLLFGPDGQEDPHFVAMGPGTPGRRFPVLRLTIEQLTPEVAGEFELGSDYLLTLEPIPKR